MRRVPIVAACLVLLALGGSGCVSHSRVARDVQTHEAGIQLALKNALRAESDWDRELWAAEYERRTRLLEKYMDGVQAEQASRAEHWRQIGQTATQAGLLLLEEALWGDGS